MRSPEGAWGDTGIKSSVEEGGMRMSKRPTMESEDAVEIRVGE